jgi:glycosyltransferase involved in cell wall biosynthesis
LKILHVIGSVAERFGGPSQAVFGMARSIQELGHQATIYTTNIDGRDRLWQLHPQVTEAPVDRPVLRDGVEVWHFKANYPGRWAFSTSLARALHEQVADFDIVHVHSLYLFSTLAAGFSARRKAIPYVVRPHGSLDPFLWHRGRLKKWPYEVLIERRNLNRAAAIHYTSQDEMELAAPLRIRARPVVVPLGIDSTAYDPLPPRGSFRSQFPEIGDAPMVLFLGRLTLKKGLDLLVDAFGQLAERFQDLRVVIAGPDDEGMGRAVRGWLDAKGLLGRTTFTGMLIGEAKRAALADADVWVLPSYDENFGFAVLEALASGLPVVTTDRVGIWREIQQAEAGLIVPCDVHALSAAIARFLEDPALREEVGCRARELVRRRFSWRSSAEQMGEVYGQLCAAAHRQPSHSTAS